MLVFKSAFACLAAMALVGAKSPDTSDGAPHLKVLNKQEALEEFSVIGGIKKFSIVGTYEVTLPQGEAISYAFSPGFLPLFVETNLGRCFTVTAKYVDGALHDQDIRASDCKFVRHDTHAAHAAPPSPSMHLVNTSWGYDIWSDNVALKSAIVRTHKDATSRFDVMMPVVSGRAMPSADTNSDAMTIVSRKGGRTILTIIALDY